MGGRRYIWLLVTVAALGLRVAVLPLSPRWGFLGDHDTFVRWAIQATDRGVLSVYDEQPPAWNARQWNQSSQKWEVAPLPNYETCNYPPLSVYLLYGAGLVFRAVSADRLINTITSHAVFSAWSLLADFVLAWGCAAVVARYRGGGASLAAYAIALLLPPIWWDSAVWGQMDSVLLAPVVWMLWAILGGRWGVAGLLYGLAAALKPQAVLFIPLWAVVVATARPRWKPLVGLGLSCAVLIACAAPFLVHGGLAWWRASYAANLTQAYQSTTLKAFNIWYADLLWCGSDDVTARWLGVAKDVWGRGLLALGLAGGFLFTLLRWRRDARSYLPWTVLSLLAFTLLPTRVHERYLVLLLPFLVVAVVWRRRFLPGLALLTIVASAQVTWLLWLKVPPGVWNRFESERTAEYRSLSPEQRKNAPALSEHLRSWREEYLRGRSRTVVIEWVLVGLALAGALATTVAAVSLGPTEQGASPRRNHPSRAHGRPARAS